jgi:hypothetical protein
MLTKWCHPHQRLLTRGRDNRTLRRAQRVLCSTPCQASYFETLYSRGVKRTSKRILWFASPTGLGARNAAAAAARAPRPRWRSATASLSMARLARSRFSVLWRASRLASACQRSRIPPPAGAPREVAGALRRRRERAFSRPACTQLGWCGVRRACREERRHCEGRAALQVSPAPRASPQVCAAVRGRVGSGTMLPLRALHGSKSAAFHHARKPAPCSP